MLKSKVNIFSVSINDLINNILVIYAFLLPFSNAFVVFTAPYFLFVLWILEGDFKRKIEKIMSFKPLLFLSTFLLFTIFSLLWSNDIKEAVHNIKFYLAVFIPFIIIFTSLNKKYLKIVIMAFLSGMFISEIMLYGVFFEWWSIRRATPENPSPFMHHILYSIFLASTIFILIWQVLDKNKDYISSRVRLLETIFIFSTTANLFLNNGRTGQLVFAISFFVFLISFYGLKLKYILISFISLSSIFFLAYQISPIFHSRVNQGISDIRNMQRGNFNTSWGLRVVMKKEAVKIVQKEPIWGFGIGDDKSTIRLFFRELIEKYPFLRRLSHIHDQYLQILIQVGFIWIDSFSSVYTLNF